MCTHQDYIKITSSTPVTMKVHTTSTTVLLLVCRAAGLIGRPLYGVLQAHLCPSVQPAPHRGRYGIAALRWCLPASVCPVNARERVLDTCDCPDAVTCDQCVAIAQRQSCSGNHHPRQSPMAVRRKKVRRANTNHQWQSSVALSANHHQGHSSVARQVIRSYAIRRSRMLLMLLMHARWAHGGTTRDTEGLSDAARPL